MLQRTEMRLNCNRGKFGLRGTNSGDDAQQIVVWMGAPRMRIRARRLRLFGPGREAERNHGSPRTEEVEVAVAEAGVLDRAREIKTEIVRCGGHRRNFAAGVEARVGRRQDTSQQLLLLVAGHDVEPDGKDIGMLAEVRLRRGVGEERVLFVPAQFFDSVDRAVGSGAIKVRSCAISKSDFYFRGVAQGFDELQRHGGRSAVGILRGDAKSEVASPIDKRPPEQRVEWFGGSLMAQEPVERCARSGELRTNE